MQNKIEVVQKPWGHEEIWIKTDRYVGKRLFIKRGHQLSLQYHNVKDEAIYVCIGELLFTYDGHTHVLNPGDSWHIEPGKIHRMAAPTGDVLIFEVSTPEISDVVRLEDQYGRESGKSH